MRSAYWLRSSLPTLSSIGRLFLMRNLIFFASSWNLLVKNSFNIDEGDLQKKTQAFKKEGRLFSEKEVWKAATHTIKGLLTLHHNSILHRDIKSANVFIHNGIYKLGDLNVSKVQDSSTKLAYTQTGTPYYASP